MTQRSLARYPGDGATGFVDRGEFPPQTRRLLKKTPCQFLKHEPVAGRREMIVAENVEMLVPVLVGASRGEEDRKQVDERLAPALAELAPERNLPAVTIAL